jgi:proline dehydrogenase
MLRSVILSASRNHGLEKVVTRAPVTREVVHRFVGGADESGAVGAASRLVEQGLLVSIDHLGEDIEDAAQAQANADAYVRLLEALHRAGLTERLRRLTTRAEVSVKLSALGQALGGAGLGPGDGAKLALDHARRICVAADAVGAAVTLDMEDHTTTDSTLDVLRTLRADFPDTACVLQAYLRRTEGDCRDLAVAGSRVRLCKGAYNEPESVAFQSADEVDRSYVRCLNTLFAGAGYPMWATHDPRLIEIAQARATAYRRGPDEYEFQMLYGIRPNEQRRLAAEGHAVRVYLPYGRDWYGYLRRRLAEHPANLMFFLRSLASKG